jgi:hypothetical protein
MRRVPADPESCVMTRHLYRRTGLCIASALGLASTVAATVSQAQPPPGYNPNAPPPGTFAPPPTSAGRPYDSNAYESDQAYAQQFSAWAARYCVDRRNNNVAAGALIGGLLGSTIGAGAGGGRGAFVGGALGAGTGAAVGSARSRDACPPGYVVRAGAPPFAYAPPPSYVGPNGPGPGWYHPWAWEGGRWVYYPYRSWYWSHRGYWRR